MKPIMINESMLQRISEFPYLNPQDYVTIESCKAACQGLQMKMSILHYGMIAIIILLVFYIVHDQYLKSKAKV